MIKEISMCRKLRGGFTMFEMLLVIAIITILIGVSLFAMQGSRESARDARRRADLESVRSAIEIYRADCNFYPASLTFNGTWDLTGTDCSNTNTYMSDLPQDTVSGRIYRYTRITNTTYELCAALETETTALVGVCGNPNGCTADCTYRVTNP
jgi:general secretion pathway protein G